MNRLRLFGIYALLLTGLLAWLLLKRNWAALGGALAGGLLGIGSYWVLERVVASIGGPVRGLGLKVGMGMAALGGLIVLLALLPVSVVYVIAGYSCFVASLLVNTLWEAAHA